MALKQKKEFASTWYVGEGRNIFVEHNFQNYSQKAADILIDALGKVLQKKKNAVFVPSSGKSTKKLYEILCQMYRDEIDWSRVVVVQMDEYWKIPCNDRNSMALNIEQNLVSPLGIKNYIHFFNNHGALMRKLDQYDDLLEEMGGIDIVVHGIGRNGHIGFNEPGSDWSSVTRKVRLDDSTIEANFDTDDLLSIAKYRIGVTIGLSSLTKAKHAILLLSGVPKNAIIKKLFSEKPSPAIPASSLFLNPKVNCIIDAESISSL